MNNDSKVLSFLKVSIIYSLFFVSRNFAKEIAKSCTSSSLNAGGLKANYLLWDKFGFYCNRSYFLVKNLIAFYFLDLVI